jgi:hypothetical protein
MAEFSRVEGSGTAKKLSLTRRQQRVVPMEEETETNNFPARPPAGSQSHSFSSFVLSHTPTFEDKTATVKG